jgi:hypothetical protein
VASSEAYAEFISDLQSLSDPEYDPQAVVESLLDLISESLDSTIPLVPYQHLEPLLSLLDPDSDPDEGLAQLTFRLIAELVNEPWYINFFARPDALQLFWGWATRVVKALTVVERIVVHRPPLLDVLLDLGLADELAASTGDTALSFAAACLRARSDIFTDPLVAELMGNAHHQMFESNDPNVIDAAFEVVSGVIHHFPDAVALLEEQLPEYAGRNQDDCTVHKLLDILAEIVRIAGNFDVLVHPPFMEIVIAGLQERSPWIAFVFKLLDGGCDVAPLIEVAPLIDAVMDILGSESPYAERAAAFRFMSRVLEKARDAARAQIARGGFLAAAVLFLPGAGADVQAMVLRCLIVMKERNGELELGEELIAVLEKVSDGQDADVVELYNALID